jgi:hypothetical protein
MKFRVIRPYWATGYVIQISCVILQAPETERAWQRFTRQESLVQSQHRPPNVSVTYIIILEFIEVGGY